MDVREKLVELLENHCSVIGEDNCKASQNEKCTPRDCAICLASNLIAHGVTVQECGHWEDDHGDYVCSCCHKAFTDDLVWLVRGESNEPNYCPNCGAKMMPQPPKGE